MIVSSAYYQIPNGETFVKVSAGVATVVRLPDNGTVTIIKTDSSANAVTVVPKLGVDLMDGTRQVETATAAGTVTVAGNATVTVTGAYITDSPLAISVPVLEGDGANAIAAAIRNALNNTGKVTEHYFVTGSAASIILTAKDYKATDSTLNVAIADGTSTGVTTAATSTGTTAGVAVQLAKQDEYKTLTKTFEGWVVVDSGGANRTETLVNKTLTSPILTTPKIADGDAGLTITSADQTHATPVATIPNIGDAADTFVMADTAQALTNKTLTSPVLDNACFGVTSGTHDYAGAAVDWTLSQAEALKPVHRPTNANAPVNAILGTSSIIYAFINATGQTLTVKTAAGTGVAIANGKTAMVMPYGGNVIRITPDA
jgi:hypothetical protein